MQIMLNCRQYASGQLRATLRLDKISIYRQVVFAFRYTIPEMKMSGKTTADGPFPGSDTNQLTFIAEQVLCNYFGTIPLCSTPSTTVFFSENDLAWFSDTQL